MTKDSFKKLTKDFYERNKYFNLIDVVAKSNGHQECQLCGNKILKKLCHIRNDEKDKEWFIGWNCWEAVEALQEKEQKRQFAQVVKCSDCGKESLRGTLPRGAYAAGLCKQCWMEKNQIVPMSKGMSTPVSKGG